MRPNDSPQIIHLGIDVAKDSLQVDNTVLPALPVVPNTKAGHQRLIKAILKLKTKAKALSQVHVVLEATGGYERPLMDALHQAAIPVSRMNAARVRAFATATGTLAKTDPIDARMLTLFGQKMAPAPTVQLTDTQRELAEITQRRTQLIKLLVMEKNRLPTHSHPILIKQAQKGLQALQKQIDQLDALVTKLSQQNPDLQQKIQRLCQLKGVSTVTAQGVLAAMPELGTLNRRQAASLAGLAPRNRDSGSKEGRRYISGGRTEVRRALYMAALTASHHNPILKTFYQHLINEGKAPKLALTAVMRKLLSVMNQLIKNPDFTLA